MPLGEIMQCCSGTVKEEIILKSSRPSLRPEQLEMLTALSRAEGLPCAVPFVTAACCKYSSFLRIYTP